MSPAAVRKNSVVPCSDRSEMVTISFMLPVPNSAPILTGRPSTVMLESSMTPGLKVLPVMLSVSSPSSQSLISSVYRDRSALTFTVLVAVASLPDASIQVYVTVYWPAMLVFTGLTKLRIALLSATSLHSAPASL